MDVTDTLMAIAWGAVLVMLAAGALNALRRIALPGPASFIKAMLAVVPAWRGLQRQARGLPVWRFAARLGVTLAPCETLRAELRCGMCDAKGACARLLEQGARKPPENCFNLDLLKPV